MSTSPAVRTPDGGPAFPTDGDVDSVFGIKRERKCFGMSLRDYFAAQFITGFSVSEADPEVNCIGYERLAELAYRLADAMLVERAKGGGA